MKWNFKTIFMYLLLVLSAVMICKDDVEAKKSSSPTYVSKNLRTQRVKEYKIEEELNSDDTWVKGSRMEMNVNCYGQIVGSKDTRQTVKNTKDTPYAYVCYIVYTYANGKSTTATGWLAGPDILVTSAH